MREIGRRVGVSHAAVSYVLNDKGRERGIPEKTEQRIRAVAAEMGWQPNHMLSAFSTGKTRLIGLWQRGFGEAYHSWVTKTVQELLQEDGYAMLNSPAYTDDSNDEHDLRLFNRWSVEGLIALGGAMPLVQFLNAHPDWRLPLVHMGSFPFADSLAFDTVYVDVLTPARAGLERWYAGGRRRIAMLAGHGPFGDDRHPREDMYLDFTREYGLKEELIAFPKGVSQRVGARQVLKRHIARYGCPEAIFCRSDEVLMGAAKVLQELGRKVPDEVDLLGIDGIQDIYYLSHPASTVAQPVEEMCQVAWRLLQERIAEPDGPLRREVLQGTLMWPVRIEDEPVSTGAE